MGIRKSYRSLTSVERDRLVQALLDLKSKGIVDQFAALHEEHFNHGIHKGSHFLPWHREFILRFEAELRKFHPDITLPYWDSSVDQSPSDPLWQSTFLGQFNQPWHLARSLGSDTLPTRQQVQSNQGRGSYDVFWPELENDIHNPPHRWVGGVMAGAASPGDPVFYLHHCWIDLLWARWQLANPGAPFLASRPGQGLNDPLMGWPDRTPAHLLDHHALGYDYDIEPVAAARPNIVWHNSNTNDTQIWQMNGERITRRATVLDEGGNVIRVGPPWHIVGTGDLNGDGKSDIVWHNSSTNDTQIWQMNGERITRRATVLDEGGNVIRVGRPWHIVGTGDLNGDGKSDIVWHNSSTNDTQIWQMNGERITRRATVLDEGGNVIRVGPPWHIVGTGDLNGDGKSDIVWHNSSTNDTQIWQMNGERITRRATVLDEGGNVIRVGPPWHIVGTGDLNGDGKSDIVWHNSSTNDTQIWQMNGERITRRATVLDEGGNVIRVGPPWHIVGNGATLAFGAIFWHNTASNDLQFWFMNGSQIKGRNGVVDENGDTMQIGPPWNIAGVAGLADETAILWHNTASNDLQFWFMNGSQIKGRNGVVDENGDTMQIGPPWNIAGVAGLADETAILWHNTASNDLQFWFMNGSQIKGRNGVVDESGDTMQIGPPWNIAGVAGLADETAILWHNTASNDLQFWFMNGSQIKGRNGVVDESGNTMQIGPPWNIAGVAGLADENAILWHNTASNDLQFWFMNGSQIKGRNGVVDESGNTIQVGPPWNIAAAVSSSGS